MNTMTKHSPRARSPAPTPVPVHASMGDGVALQTVPLAWWQHGLNQQLVAQQSLWDAWQVWAWIPWNLTISAWQVGQLATPSSPAPSGMLFSVLGGSVPSAAPELPPQASTTVP